MFEQLYGKTGVKTILGSGLMWAWFDAFYMSSLFPASGAGMLSEMCAAAVFLLTIPFLVAALLKPTYVHALLSSRQGMIAVGMAGSTGSLLFVVADMLGMFPLAVLACVLCALFMAFMTVAWGSVYAQGGSITATPYVAGAFACAIAFDVPLLFMIPTACAVFYALFPLISCLVFLGIDAEDRTYASVLDASVPIVGMRAAKRRPLASLGIPCTILFGYVLVMVGFAYLQHLISFSPVVSGGHAYGIFVQAARGVAAVVIFFVIWHNLRHSRFVYRVGLPMMIAGCMSLTLTFNSSLFVLSAAVIIAGYTAFDLFVWAIFSSIACTQSSSPMGTIIVMRIVCAVGHTIGAVVGICLVGFDAGTVPMLTEMTTFAGYFIVIAAVLLLSSEEVFALSNGYFDFRDVVSSLRERYASGSSDFTQTGDAGDVDDIADADVNDWLDARFAELGLTARESDVARQLTHGRTQKWIADYLCISQNTVGTHLRRIYQKAGVHTRQQFLDVLSGDLDASHETRDVCDQA